MIVFSVLFLDGFLRSILSKQIYYFMKLKIAAIRCGLVVRIPGFHPGGPGSIPGTGI